MRRPIVAIYFLVLLGSFAGAVLYAPSNYDALSYRIPQLLHWIDLGGWHWIDAANSRMNIAPPGMNWLIAPFYFLTKSDRLWFVINLAAFTLLPGSLFELFRRAGASPRAAWWFMWIIPCGYAFALQAGSLGNDLLGTVYAVSGIALALRARESQRVSDVWLASMAMAMATGVKSLNLPLLIPWVIAVWPALRLLVKRPAGTVVALAISVFASCLPTVVLNIRQTGSWTGDPKDEHGVRPPTASAGFTSNAILLAIANTQPPLLPNPATWNQRVTDWLKRTPLDAVCKSVPRFEVRWGELPTEESASLGPGVLVTSGICLLSVFRRRRRCPVRRPPIAWALAVAAYVSFLLFLACFSSEAIGRLSSSFAPFLLLPVVFIAGAANALRSKWITRIAVFGASLSLPPLILSPARPLFPWKALPAASQFDRVRRVYSVYSQRADAFAPLRRFIPERTRTIWMISFGDEPETSLWRPFGTHQVRHLTSGQPAITSDSILVASDPILMQRYGVSASAFAVSHGLQIAGSEKLNLRASGSAELWHVLLPAHTNE